jgi:uncharacterized protein YcfJ
MKKITLIAVSLAVSAPFAAPAAQFEDVATVKSIAPMVERINTPRQVCYTEYVTSGPSSQPSERNYGGAVLGGIAGALLGNQVGKGTGRTAGTAVGAAVGALTGDHLANESGAASAAPSAREVQRCHMEDRWSERTTGYSVTYQYHRREFTIVMPRDPGVGIGGPLPVQVSVNPY